MNYKYLSLSLSPLIFMAIRRFYIYYINKKNLYGEDKNMIKWEKILEKPNYVPMIFDFKNLSNIELNNYWNKIKENVNNEINKNSDICYDINGKEIIKINKRIDNICFVSEMDYNSLILLKDIHKNSSVIINYNPNRKTISFIINHTVFDGSRSYNEIIIELIIYLKYLRNIIQKKKNIYYQKKRDFFVIIMNLS